MNSSVNKNQTTQQRRNTKRKQSSRCTSSRVTFSDFHQVHRVPQISSFSAEQLGQIWFDDQETRAIVEEIQVTVERMNFGEALIDNKYTSTGLESFTTKGRAQLIAVREDAYDAVLLEQEDQILTGRRDSRLLAKLYRQVSREASRRAYRNAMRVHEEVLVDTE